MEIFLVSKARIIKIYVHYLDTWLGQNSPSISEFFERGGNLEIILPNPENKEVIGLIKSRFADFNKQQEIERKIKNTKSKLEQIQKHSKNKNAEVTVHFTNSMIWHFAIMVNNDLLLLSPFEHSVHVNVKSPIFEIDLKKLPRFYDWFVEDYNELIKQAEVQKADS